MRFTILIPALATLAIAGPVAPAAYGSNSNKGANLFCSVVKGYVTAAKQQNAATAYCASVLSIPVATSTSTTVFTSTIVSVATVYTSTATITTSVQLTCANPVPTVQVPTKRNAEPSPASDARLAVNEVQTIERRARAPVRKPSCLGSYGTNQLVTSACKCLGIAASTTTITSTSTSISTSSTTTSLVATETATATSNFKIMITGSSKYDGRFMQVGDGFGSGGQIGTDYTSGSVFSLAPNGALIARTSTNGYAANAEPGTYYATHGSATSTFVSFVASKYLEMDDAKRLNCKITTNVADGSCGLTCTVGSVPPANINNACPRLNYPPPWYLGAAAETNCGESTFSESQNGVPFQMRAVTGGEQK